MTATLCGRCSPTGVLAIPDPAAPSLEVNLRIGREFALAMKHADAAVIADLLAPDAVWHFPGEQHALAGDHSGLAAIAAFAGKALELTDGSFAIELRDVYASPEGAVIAFTGTATRADHRVLNNPTLLALRISDGRVQELWEFVWDAAAVAAFWR